MHSFLKRKAIRKPDTNKKNLKVLLLYFLTGKQKYGLQKKKKCVIKLNLNFHYGNPLAKRPNINTVKHCRDVYMNLKQRPKKKKSPNEVTFKYLINLNLKQILKTVL